jgi:leader peptidase (prepilin peptidase)/N-methyltransferase
MLPVSLSLAQSPAWWSLHLPTVIACAFVFCFGACVGSFLNVVIYRLPAGMSVISPPSRCPTCGAHLRFFRENLPILGWFLVRGKCRYCGVKISPQYMIIELLMALTFVALYLALYGVSPATPLWGDIGGPWWHRNGIVLTWPAYTAWAFLIAGLVAMTVIDARTFTIPIQIPLFVTFAAFIAYPIQYILPTRQVLAQTWPIVGVGWVGFTMSLGGMLGVLISYALLRTGRLRYSFADYGDFVKEGEVLGDYPHARREMIVELIYLGPCIALMVVGWFVGKAMSAGGVNVPGEFLQVMGAMLAGYLMGGGMIWGIRILGTLAFGREAMGLGDVHLLAAVGAVLGWSDPIIIFFIAPFFGLLWALFSKGLGAIFRSVRRELPYGPHLAAATLAMIVFRGPIHHGFAALMPNVPFPPAPGFITPLGAGPAAAGTPASRPARTRRMAPATQPVAASTTQP